MSVAIGIVIEGDSLTYGGADNSVGPVSYVYAAAGLTTASGIPGTSLNGLDFSRASWRFPLAGCIAANVSVAGSRLNTNSASESYPGDLTFRAAERVDALINSDYPSSRLSTGLANNRAARKYIFSVLVGTNPDTSNFTTAASNLQAYLQARVAAGFTGLVVGTLVSRGDGILADFETYRQGYNAILRTAEWQNGIGARVVALSDFGNEPTIGAPGACNNATLFSDTIHPTTTGYSYMTPLYGAAVNMVKSLI